MNQPQTPTNEVARLREKVERQAERIRYLEGATNHACGTPLSRANNEVARLRELLNRAIKTAEEYRKHASKNINEDCDWSMQDLHKKFNAIQARLAPAPEETVTEKASKFSVNPSFYEKCNVCGESYGDHTGHPDDPHCPLQEPVSDWKCPHCGSTTGTWFSRVEPMGDFCEDCGKAVDEEPIVVNTEPSNLVVDQKTDNVSDNEWRELGPDEVIGAADEYNPASLGEWIKVPHGWIGEKCDITKIRTRRPLCPNDAPKQEDEYHNHLHAWMRLQEDTNREVAKEISYLRDEIQKLKQK